MVATVSTWKTVRRELVQNRFRIQKVPGFANYAELEEQMLDLSEMTSDEQEAMIVNEMLLLLTGHQMTNIRVTFSPHFELNVNPTLHLHLRSMIGRFERIIQYCAVIRRKCYQILSEVVVSTAVKAIAIECERLLDEEFVAVLGSSEGSAEMASLIDVFFQVSHFEPRLQLTSEILANINEGDLVGGEVLSLLASRVQQSVRDDTTRLLHTMQTAALRQFLAHLRQWICHGTVEHDATAEFFVWSTRSLKPEQIEAVKRTTAPIEERIDLGADFLVVQELCPSIFQTHIVDIIKCGHYLHILAANAENAEEVEAASLKAAKALGPAEEWLNLPVNEVKRRVVAARNLASTRILRHLREKWAVADVFNAVQCLFLVRNGSWFSLLLNHFRKDLEMDKDAITERRLLHIFDVIVTDPNSPLRELPCVNYFGLSLESDSVLQKLVMLGGEGRLRTEDRSARYVTPPENWIEDELNELKEEKMLGLSALSLKFACPAMLTPLFPKQQLQIYSNIFRLLFATHVAVDEICECQRVLPTLKRSDDPLLRKCAGFIQTLLSHIQKFLEHCCCNVIAPQLAKFNDEIFACSSMEEMALCHEALLFNICRALPLDNTRLFQQLFHTFRLVRKIADGEVDYVTGEQIFAEIRDEMQAALVESGSNEALAHLLIFTRGD